MGPTLVHNACSGRSMPSCLRPRTSTNGALSALAAAGASTCSSWSVLCSVRCSVPRSIHLRQPEHPLAAAGAVLSQAKLQLL
eukprot:80081-Chlamydomonas_euryale.AAC.1